MQNNNLQNETDTIGLPTYLNNESHTKDFNFSLFIEYLIYLSFKQLGILYSYHQQTIYFYIYLLSIYLPVRMSLIFIYSYLVGVEVEGYHQSHTKEMKNN